MTRPTRLTRQKITPTCNRIRRAARWSLCLLFLGALLAGGLPARRADAAAALTLCTAVPSEIAAGLPFTYTVSNTATGASTDVVVPSGECRTYTDLTGGAPYAIREQIPTGFRMTDIAVDGPAASRVAINLAQATVAFAIADGGAATVTFINAAIGTLRICREGAPGLDPAARFRFTIANGRSGRSDTSIPIPANQCVFIDGLSLANAVGPGPGPYTVQEIAPPGLSATTITATGPGVAGVRIDPTQAAVSFTLDATGAATVSFANAPMRPAAATCADFASDEDAQAYLDADSTDPDGIDPDGDFIACNHGPALAGPPPIERPIDRIRPLSRRVCPPSHPIKGDRSLSGELTYHVPGGASYAQIEPEECFATEADAQAAGYRPAQR